VSGAERKIAEMAAGNAEEIDSGRPPSFRPGLPIN